jgi:hypothetical protein
MTTTEENPRVVGATAVHLVGVEGTIEAIGDGTITIDGVTLPSSIAGPVRLVSMHWPADQSKPDHAECIPEEDFTPLEAENLRLKDWIARLHEENHTDVFAVCLHEVCKRATGRW